MVCDLVGDDAFDTGMRAFMHAAANGPAGHDEFIAAISKAAGRDVRAFVMPWLTEKSAPDLDARLDGSRVIVTQLGPLYDLPLPLALTTTSGEVRRSVHVFRRSDTLDVRDLGPVTAVRTDPDGRFLLKRHLGDVARFEIRADSARLVALVGDFAARPIPAVKQDGRWIVEIPLVEGRYYWVWQINGVVRDTDYNGEPTSGVRIVRPVRRVEGAYPHL